MTYRSSCCSKSRRWRLSWPASSCWSNKERTGMKKAVIALVGIVAVAIFASQTDAQTTFAAVASNARPT